MTGARFELLLKEKMGLDGASIGAPAIARAVEERLRASALANTDAYWEFVHQSTDEVQRLIEAVVVPETWFFRDKAAFSALGDVLRGDIARATPDRVFRVLSLPCSTGEEPHSMAMEILDAGLPSSRIRIDAVDISNEALDHARRGVYGKNSFRGADLAFRDRHFTAEPGGHRLRAGVAECVRFQRGNILDDALLATLPSYDAIFCRNLLIYFDRATQDRAVTVLARLLTPEGVLFVGPSETGLIMSHNFSSLKIPFAFAFRKTDASQTVAAAVPRRPAAVRAPAYAPAVAPARIARANPARQATPPMQPVPAAAGSEPPLGEAQRLADQGRLAEAAKRCEAQILEHGPSVDALYLLAVIRDATGQHADAADLYRKALYLDPFHQEALVHLASLLGKQDDAAGARLLMQRAERAARKREQ